MNQYTNARTLAAAGTLAASVYLYHSASNHLEASTTPNEGYPLLSLLFLTWSLFAIFEGARPIWNPSYDPFLRLGGNSIAARSRSWCVLTILVSVGSVLAFLYYLYLLLYLTLPAVGAFLVYAVSLTLCRWVARKAILTDRAQADNSGEIAGDINGK